MNHYEFEMPGFPFDENKFDKVAEIIFNTTKGKYTLNKTGNPSMIIVSSNDFLTLELAFKFGIIFAKFY